MASAVNLATGAAVGLSVAWFDLGWSGLWLVPVAVLINTWVIDALEAK